MPAKGFHRRGYLPHYDSGGVVQAVTFREYGSLPSGLLRRWKIELEAIGVKNSKVERLLLKKIARYEDEGCGRCLLAKPLNAEIVQNSILAGHQSDYDLIRWCVMPNHVHVLFQQYEESSLGKIIRKWKGASARSINRLEGQSGPYWARDYFDREIRDPDHLQRAIDYIDGNPVSAGLVTRPEDWKFSASGCGWAL